MVGWSSRLSCTALHWYAHPQLQSQVMGWPSGPVPIRYRHAWRSQPSTDSECQCGGGEAAKQFPGISECMQWCQDAAVLEPEIQCGYGELLSSSLPTGSCQMEAVQPSGAPPNWFALVWSGRKGCVSAAERAQLMTYST